MSEFRSKTDLFDIQKDGIYYKKIAGNVLMVLRRVSYSTYWKTAKHVGYDGYYSYAKYSNIEIPKEVNGMKVISIESPGWGWDVQEMTNVSLPETIESLGDQLIEICNVVFPSNVSDSHYKRIWGCNNITLPNSLKTIGEISRCNMLTIPNSVISIESINFTSSVLKIDNSTPPILTQNSMPNDASVILVPKGSLDAYKNDPMWGKFKTIREDPSLGKGVVSTQHQTLVANNDVAEKEKAELKSQLEKKDEEIAGLKKLLAKKDEEIAKLKRQLEVQKVSEPLKPQPTPVQPAATTQPSTSTVLSAKGVFKLEEYKSKGKLCHAIVKTYVEQHPDVTLAQLKQVFNVPKCDTIVESLEKAMTMTDSSGKAGGCHYIKEAEQIKINEGIVVVWSYWPERYYPDFIANAKKAGFTIE